MATNKQLDDLLRFDGLDTAEKITGSDYKASDETVALGAVLMQINAEAKCKALVERGDVTSRDTLDRYISVVEAYGFECVLKLPFIAYKGKRDERVEHQYVFATRDGLLLVIDTWTGYGPAKVNRANVYYNWKPNDDVENVWALTSSGCMCKREDVRIWSGNHDAREALLFNIDRLRANGTFIVPWEESPRPWFVHYGEGDDAPQRYPERGEFYGKITDSRLDMLPDWVRAFIGREN